jgi:hypothetical protein
MDAIETTAEITEAEMLRAIERAGHAPPTSDQLKRWRRAGLLPRSRLEHRPGLRGSQSLYPSWTADQLLAIVRLHSSTHRLGELGTILWWEGGWVDPTILRDALSAPLERFADETAKAREGETDPNEAADLILNAMSSAGESSPLVEVIRGRLTGRGDFANLMWTFLVLALGGEAPWEQEDRSRKDPAPTALELLVRSAGIEWAINGEPAERPSWLPADFDPRRFIAELRDAGGFAIDDTARPIHEASDQALAQARADALLFCGPLARLGAVLEEFVGEEVAALGTLRAITPTSAFGRAALIRTMLILRDVAGDEAFQAITELVESTRRQFAAIAELRAALPQHESLLRADFQQRLALLEPEHSEQVRRDVAAYLQAHPSVSEALGSSEPPQGQSALSV